MTRAKAKGKDGTNGSGGNGNRKVLGVGLSAARRGARKVWSLLKVGNVNGISATRTALVSVRSSVDSQAEVGAKMLHPFSEATRAWSEEGLVTFDSASASKELGPARLDGSNECSSGRVQRMVRLQSSGGMRRLVLRYHSPKVHACALISASAPSTDMDAASITHGATSTIGGRELQSPVLVILLPSVRCLT
ncbi:hypothetical protein BCR44DRAFT_1264568 [Catenaria anguillulae PL171]|uniref:Uncharacterized protein n=1 Tax=Catenaria anguillulae PL171 TaxID=765915 RepID=A0A1Y2HAG3_9FUNG|nr:hypothetical protein BCR44DRAFT_1264568 [Catenaria anguillulae PL171]